MSKRLNACMALILALLLAFSGFALGEGTPLVTSMQAISDPSLATEDMQDPYSQLNPYTAKVYNPDPELYNTLFRALEARKKSVNISAFKNLSIGERNMTANSLYAEAGYHFFYLNRLKLSSSGKTVTFTYRKLKDLPRMRESLNARLSHLVYNVAPQSYTELQKFMAVYEYLCKTSCYTDDMSDEMTTSPSSILLIGKGICNGYANLMAYTLNRVGVKTEYVCDMAHAWNIVNLGGAWYHTDATWGAGLSPNDYDSLQWVLMDDEARLESLRLNGIDEPIILGYPSSNEVTPPPCTDTQLMNYETIGKNYALDLDGGKVYFEGPAGINRMNLDGTGRETVLEIMATHMVFFNGTLYYIDTNDGFLYRLIPGQKPECLSRDEFILYLWLSGSTLSYGLNAAKKDAKTISLLTPPAFSERDTQWPEATVPRSRSFCVQIGFSKPLDPTQNLQERVYLLGDGGTPVPIHAIPSDDGLTLTLRPKDCVADYPFVTCVLTGDTAFMDGQTAEKSQVFTVKIASEAKGK